MNDEFNTSVGIEDLLSEEEEVFTTEPVNLKTGVSGNATPDPNKTASVNPNAVRWLFNPFEVIDLTNEPTSCGIPYLKNVVFNEIKSLNVNVSNNGPYDLAAGQADPGAMQHVPENYDQFKRTALMIAEELQRKNGDKGVVEIKGIQGQDEATAASLNTLLFGDEVECTFDINFPDFPCPVLPNLLEVLAANVKTNAAGLDAETRNIVIGAAKQVRDAISLAMRNARTRVDEAQKRLLDEKNPNRNLSIAEQRCYLALGEEIPNIMPFLTRNQAAGIGAGQGIDSEALGRGIGMAIAAQGSQALARGKIGGVRGQATASGAALIDNDADLAFADVDFGVNKADIEETEKTPPKGRATKGQNKG